MWLWGQMVWRAERKEGGKTEVCVTDFSHSLGERIRVKL